MTKIQGPNFGVRFYRRPMPKAAVKAPVMPSFKLTDMWKAVMNLPQPTTLILHPLSVGEREGVMGWNDLCAARPPHPTLSPTGRGLEVDGKEKQLWAAARHGDCYKIRVLVMDGVDLDARDPQGRTALNIATQYNMAEAIKTLRAAKEMRYMAHIGDLPDTNFFRKFSNARTGSDR